METRETEVKGDKIPVSDTFWGPVSARLDFFDVRIYGEACADSLACIFSEYPSIFRNTKNLKIELIHELLHQGVGETSCLLCAHAVSVRFQKSKRSHYQGGS
eukprot:GDKI01040978.1.p2 GENE.GDKI01040978.1~~GDKI01040978.1.p2  ORF type:complete len:102 (-),score=18.91 GDKI01040978.1:416-721(-)